MNEVLIQTVETKLVLALKCIEELIGIVWVEADLALMNISQEPNELQLGCLSALRQLWVLFLLFRLKLCEEGQMVGDKPFLDLIYFLFLADSNGLFELRLQYNLSWFRLFPLNSYAIQYLRNGQMGQFGFQEFIYNFS